MKKNKLLLLVLTIIFALIIANPVGFLYGKIANITPGLSSFLVSKFWNNFFNGIVPAYIFSLFFLFTLFGQEKKYWWIQVLLIPAAAFEIIFAREYIYFPIALGVVGWLLGWGIMRLRETKT